MNVLLQWINKKLKLTAKEISVNQFCNDNVGLQFITEKELQIFGFKLISKNRYKFFQWILYGATLHYIHYKVKWNLIININLP